MKYKATMTLFDKATAQIVKGYEMTFEFKQEDGEFYGNGVYVCVTCSDCRTPDIWDCRYDSRITLPVDDEMLVRFAKSLIKERYFTEQNTWVAGCVKVEKAS